MEMKLQVSSDSSVSKVNEGSESSNTSSSDVVIFFLTPLLFVSSAPSPPEDAVGGTIDFTSIGPTEVQKLKLKLDLPNYGIPKQTVAGLRTPWIETSNFNKNTGEERRREVSCIAFGYSPITKEHKVLCISTTKKEGIGRGVSVHFQSRSGCTKEDSCFLKHEEIGVDEEQVCEVFTVGENTKRRIDAVPPYILLSKVSYMGDVYQYNEESKSVYVRSKIYWRFRYTSKGEVLMVFDVRTEKFLVIRIPGYVTETPWNFWKYPQTVELLEVDGHIVVLNFTPGCPISFWILDQDDGSNKWTNEKVKTPCNWNGYLDLSIEAIPERYNGFTVNEMYGLNYQPGELRWILTLSNSLALVCTKRCSMF
ncbi:hypothetical protein MKX03_009382 [Papaver bracteatum]|nr:hypothetical protein MKX03_009382 [Papaver bracteatum]